MSIHLSPAHAPDFGHHSHAMTRFLPLPTGSARCLVLTDAHTEAVREQNGSEHVNGRRAGIGTGSATARVQHSEERGCQGVWGIVWQAALVWWILVPPGPVSSPLPSTQLDLAGSKSFLRMSSRKVAAISTPEGRPTGEALGKPASLWGKSTSRYLGAAEAERTDSFPDRALSVPALAWDGQGRPPGRSLGGGEGSGSGPPVAALNQGTSFSSSSSFTRSGSFRGAASFRRSSALDAALMPLRSIRVRSSAGGDDGAAVRLHSQVSRGMKHSTKVSALLTCIRCPSRVRPGQHSSQFSSLIEPPTHN